MSRTSLLIALSVLLVSVASASFVVHEWGTYTSLQASSGLNAAGMHHGEEALPEFVWSRAAVPTYWNILHSLSRGINPPPLTLTTPENCGFCEVMDWEPKAHTEKEVTQKLETPVIYFYNEEAIEGVVVDVEFPKGIVCEVYPQAHTHVPEIGDVDATADGRTIWTVDVAPKGVTLPVPEVEEENIWAPSRRVDANYVRSSVDDTEEFERHIFYRGLGRFQGPARVTSDFDTLTLENNSEEPLPSAWLMVSDGERGLIRPLGSVAPLSAVSTPLTHGPKFDLTENNEETLPLAEFVTYAKDLVKASLVEANLYEKEAQAMVDTWEYSYFKSTGVRVLYVAPASYPDELLPLTITPTPDSVERVLIGRVEVLLQAEEQDVLEATLSAVLKQDAASIEYIVSLHRFAEAKMRAALAPTPFHNDSQFNEMLEEFVLEHLIHFE